MRELWPVPDDPLVDELREVARRLHLAERYRELDTHPEFPRREFRALGEAGLLGLTLPGSAGGRGLSLPRAGAVLFHLGYLGGTTFAKLALQPEFCSVLLEHGSPSLVDEWFRPLLEGRRLVGNQITEPEAGSDAGRLRMSAVRTADGFTLHGTKSEAAFAGDAEAALVYARLDVSDPRAAVAAFLVPQDLPGISRSVDLPDMGERWQRRGSVTYDRVKLAAPYAVGAPGTGFAALRGELVRDRALLAAVYLGVARASWDATVSYVGEREAFGRPLAANQAVAFSLADAAMELEAAWKITEGALVRTASGEDATPQSAMAKLGAIRAALRTLDLAVQFHGGRGYSSRLPHEQRYRDVRSGALAHGANELLQAVASRTLFPRTPAT